MKKRYKVTIGLLFSLIIGYAIFLLLTPPINYEVQADPVIYNKDKTNKKQRPFIVHKEEYPFESNWFERDGVSMHYVDEGEGIPVLLCHGNPDWSFLYRDIIKELSDECRLIAYDLPGFGFSETPAGYNFTPQEHAEWIDALVNEHLKLKEYIIVVGDWGGPTGLSVATQHPEKILGAVITNTWAWKAEGMLKAFSNINKTPIMNRLNTNRNFFVESLMIDGVNEASKNNEAIVNAYRLALPTAGSRIGVAEFPKQITIAESWLEKLENRLSTLSNKPIELIFGLKDFALGTPEIQERWLSFYPEANVQKLPDAGHFTQEDNPESFVIAIKNILDKNKGEEDAVNTQ